MPDIEKSGLFSYLNWNKAGITLNTKESAGKEIFKQLMEKADVLIEDKAPNEMEELGLAYNSLKAVNPRLIVTSITAFGQSGPYKDYKSCDLVIQHMSSVAYSLLGVVDDPDTEPPKRIGGYQADCKLSLSQLLSCQELLVSASNCDELEQMVSSDAQGCGPQLNAELTACVKTTLSAAKASMCGVNTGSCPMNPKT